jgi:hypothetical protein
MLGEGYATLSSGEAIRAKRGAGAGSERAVLAVEGARGDDEQAVLAKGGAVLATRRAA